ncbi:hypothetical protein Hanom_Chr11g00980331 [Helianthus anomalus]
MHPRATRGMHMGTACGATATKSTKVKIISLAPRKGMNVFWRVARQVETVETLAFNLLFHGNIPHSSTVKIKRRDELFFFQLSSYF